MPSILLVDDDENTSATICMFLGAHGHETVHASSGEEALKCLDARNFDLIILDWQLKDMTGLELLDRYRKSGGGALVLMMTGMRDTKYADLAKNAGADDFLCKPCSLSDISKSIDALCARLTKP